MQFVSFFLMIRRPPTSTLFHATRLVRSEKDAALERRFQPIYVGEPSVEATIAILRGLKGRYEAHHGVDITDRSEEHTSELQSRQYLVCRLLLEKTNILPISQPP